MDNSKLDAFIRPIAARLHANHMSRLGIANTMSLAHWYNQLKFGRQDRWRTALYQTQLATLLEENGSLTRPPIEIKDGWTLDNSMSLPHLDRVLEDSDKIIAERSGERRSAKGANRSYFQEVGHRRRRWTCGPLLQSPSDGRWVGFGAPVREKESFITTILRFRCVHKVSEEARLLFTPITSADTAEPARLGILALSHLESYPARSFQ